MLPLQKLAYEVEQIADREIRHRARSLLACYLGYSELQQEDPAYAARAIALRRALCRLGLTMLPANSDRPRQRVEIHSLDNALKD